MTRRLNLAASPTMRAALTESFTDQAAIDHAEDIALGRDVTPDPDGWQQGQDDTEAAYWRGMGDSA